MIELPDNTDFFVTVREGEILPDVMLRAIRRNLSPKEQRYLVAALSRELAQAGK